MFKRTCNRIAILACAFALVHTAHAAGLPDPSEFESFLDGLMTGHQDAFPYAGAVVSVVADGEIYFQKGYGFADLETQDPVNPEETLFRIGSVTKLFGWTALMQLVEQDRIDLDADVNSYLNDLAVPETYEDPVTVRHLMNHTAGFEDRLIGLFRKSDDYETQLAVLLNGQMPARVRPPSVVTSYSNHGSTLAALVLENVTGDSWSAYIDAHILKPLGMANTTAQQPPGPAHTSATSKGYANHNGVLREQTFEFVPMAPAGAVSATANDMARFMIAHLQRGEFNSTRILRDETAGTMQTRSFQNAPGVNGLAHGFIEMDRNGHRVIGHSGDTFWFHTIWAMLPDHGVGIYASYNTDSGAEARSKLFEAFMDRYFPPENTESVPAIDASNVSELKRFEGKYRSNRISYTTLEKLAALTGGIVVKIDDDGALLLRASETIRMREVGPLVFQEIDGSRRVRFLESEDGQIAKLFMNDVPVFAFDRIPMSELPILHALLLVLGLPVLLSGVIAWPAGAFSRRNDEPVFSQQHIPGAARWTAWAAASALVIFTVGFGLTMQDSRQIVYGLPAHMPVLLCLPLIATALTYVAVLFGLLFLVRRIGTLRARIHYMAVVTACVVMVWQLRTWNLLGFLY